MHELSTTEGILAVVLEEAERVEASRVTEINLVLSQASDISEEAVRFYFELLSQGTMAEAATLSFRTIPAQFQCWHCGEEFQDPGPDGLCPQCDGPATAVPPEHEFYVESIDVE
ncbi:MAG: hydrogenase maturation nickel metallochaperone HypA [Anaerolineae bacterium]